MPGSKVSPHDMRAELSSSEESSSSSSDEDESCSSDDKESFTLKAGPGPTAAAAKGRGSSSKIDATPKPEAEEEDSEEEEEKEESPERERARKLLQYAASSKLKHLTLLQLERRQILGAIDDQLRSNDVNGANGRRLGRRGAVAAVLSLTALQVRLWDLCDHGLLAVEDTVKLLAAHESSCKQLLLSADKDGETALIKATKKGHIELAVHLLRSGSDLFHADSVHRTAWWHVCFGEEIKSGVHEDLMLAFLKAPMQRHSLIVTPELMECAVLSKDKSVAKHLFDWALVPNVTGRYENNVVDFSFSGVELLDDPTTVHGLKKCSPVYHTLFARNRVDLLQHPGCLALLDWKWKQFGSFCYTFEFSLHLILCIALSAVLVCSPNHTASPLMEAVYSASELVALPITVLQFITTVADIYTARSVFGVGLSRGILLKLLCFFTLAASICCRLLGGSMTVYLTTNGTYLPTNMMNTAGPDAADALALSLLTARMFAVACFFNWLNCLTYFEMMQGAGPYFITVLNMIADVIKLVVLFLTLLPGFFFSLSFLDSWRWLVVLQAEAHLVTTEPADNPALAAGVATEGSFICNGGRCNGGSASVDFNAISLFAFMMGSSNYRLTAETDPLIIFLMVSFIFFGPLLALSLLRAIMVDTYAGVKSAADGEWAMKRANLVLFRESWVKLFGSHSPHFITSCRNRATAEQQANVQVKYELLAVKYDRFVPKKPSDFPMQNHYMLKELYDNAKNNAHVPKRNSELMEQMHMFLRTMFDDAQKNADVPKRNARLMEAMHGFLTEMHDVNIKNADVPKRNSKLMESMNSYLVEMHEANRNNADVPRRNAAAIESIQLKLEAHEAQLTATNVKLDKIINMLAS